MEDINRVVSALASLIMLHNKRIAAYQSLAEKTPHEDIKSLCTRYIDQSKQFASNLSTWRSAYGGFTKLDGQSGSKGGWRQVRSLFGFSSEKSLINRCEQLEQETLKMYKSVMQLIPAATVADLRLQTKELEKALKRLQEQGERAELIGSLVAK